MTCTDPELPEADEPDLTCTAPLGDVDEVAEVSSTADEAPVRINDPSAEFASAPVESPDVTIIDPPIKPLPADKTIDPPSLSLLVPTVILTSPDEPD